MHWRIARKNFTRNCQASSSSHTCATTTYCTVHRAHFRNETCLRRGCLFLIPTWGCFSPDSNTLLFYAPFTAAREGMPGNKYEFCTSISGRNSTISSIHSNYIEATFAKSLLKSSNWQSCSRKPGRSRSTFQQDIDFITVLDHNPTLRCGKSYHIITTYFILSRHLRDIKTLKGLKSVTNA